MSESIINDNANYKTIKLGTKRKDQGEITTIVSVEDFDMLSKYSWSLGSSGYVQGRVNGKTTRMSGLIMNAKHGQIVDHINGIKTDNRRCNLRLSNSLLNGRNIRKHKTKTPPTSIYRGIYRNKQGIYLVKIKLDNIVHNIGRYDTELNAAEAWDMYIVHNKLDNIELNFPGKRDEYLQREYKEYKPKQSSRQFIGVKKSGNVYEALIGVKNRRIYIGSFKNIIEAAEKYDDYIVTNNIFGKKLNFPNRYPDYSNKMEIKTKYEEINSTTIKLLLEYKDDKYVTIDKNDYDKVKHYTCYVGEQGYAFVLINNKSIRLHRHIFGCTDPNIYIDHIDGNKLNNRLSNLRKSNASLNPQNRKKQKNASSSKHIGVSYYKKVKKWCAEISSNHKVVFFASYTDEEPCARARDLYIIDNLPDSHYKLNFKWSKKDIVKWRQKLSDIEKAYSSSFSSSYVGVSFNKEDNKWLAYVYLKNKRVFSKLCESQETAARTRDLYILQNCEKKYKMNFEWTSAEIVKWKKLLKF